MKNEIKQESVNFDQIGTVNNDQLYWIAELASNLALATKLGHDWSEFNWRLAKANDDNDMEAYDKYSDKALDDFVLTIGYKDTSVKLSLWNDERLYESFMEFLKQHASEMSDRIRIARDCFKPENS